MKKQLGNEEIVRMIERQQVISYKKKNEAKQPHKQSKQDQDDFQSAQSLKSNVFSDDSVRFHKKNTPLPQLSKDRRRVLGKGLISLNQHKSANNYFDKEVRQHDNLVLKQQNNFLTTENMKLKTKLMTLEKQNARLQKLLQQDPQKSKVQPVGTNSLITRDQRNFKQGTSTKMIVRSLKKEVDQLKKENTKIKWSVKFTRINELQIQRDAILQETSRLRLLLDEQLGKRAHLKLKQHGMSHMEQKLISLQQKNTHLMKQNQELSMKLKKTQQNSKKVQKISQNEKNLNRMLFNARRVIREKEKEIQSIRSQGTTSANDIPLTQKNIGQPASQSMKETNKVNVITNKNSSSKQKRVMSKSAQKYRSSVNKSSAAQSCQNCKRLIDQIKLLQKKIEELSLDLKQQKQKNTKKGMGEISKDPIIVPSKQNIQVVSKFITYRFKAHHLTNEEALKYLINNENTQQQLTVGEIVQSLIAQPFSVISNQYLDAIIYGLVYDDYIPDKSNKVTLDENKKITKKKLLNNFTKLIPGVQLMAQARQQQMFIQIAELITNYHQHILTALNGKRNGQGTISQKDLSFFFNEIQLEKQYVDFIITQIILESYDLEHLNYYAMFQIFYMPTQDLATDEGMGIAGNNKRKFEVDHVVKQQDQQYEQSRSYVDAKQKTLSKRDDDDIQLKSNELAENEEFMKGQGKSQNNIHQEQQEEYQQLFEQQKMNRVPQEEKTNQNHKPYDLQQQKPYQLDEQYAQDYQN